MPIIVCFEGNLAADATHTTTPTGKDLAEATVLCNRRTKRAGEWQGTEPTRYNIKAWERHATHLADLTKGTRVVIIGHVETSSWETPTGDRRYRDTVVIDSLGIVPSSRSDEQSCS